MRLLDRLTKPDAVRTLDAYPYNGLGEFLMTAFGTPDDEKIVPMFGNAAAWYTGNGVVFATVLRRLNLFAEAQFKWQRLKDHSLFGDAGLTLLEEPWPGCSTGELLARMEQDVSLAGNSFTRKVSDEYLERLRPDWVTIVSAIVDDGVSQYRQVLGYDYDPIGDREREAAFYPVEEVAHWSPIPDPLASFRGMSWLTPIMRDIDADTQLTDYKRAYLNNAATPNLLVKYPEKKEIGDPAMKRLRAMLEERHGGVRNAFRTLILDQGADATVIGDNLNKAAVTAVQNAGELRIAAAGGVPPMLVGIQAGLDASTLANYNMAWRTFADGTMRPNWRTACAALSKLVTVPSGAKLWFDTSQIAALQEGQKEKADTMQVLASAANTLVTAGFSKESIKAALAASDVTLLQDTGLVSVQLQEPGSDPTPPEEPKPTQGGDA